MTGAQLTEVLPGLTAALVDGSNPTTFLTRLVAAVPVVLDVLACAVVAPDPAGRTRLVAASERPEASSFTSPLLDGPWNACLATGLPDVNVDVAAEDDRWRTFRRVAADNGVGYAHVLPVQVSGRVLGVLALVSGPHRPLEPTSAAVGQAFADLAALGLLELHRVSPGPHPGHRLGAVWEASDTVAQAIGVLRVQGAVGAPEAIDRLHHHASASGVPVSEVCAGILRWELSWPDLVAEAPAPDTDTDTAGGGPAPSLDAADRELLRLVSGGLPASVVALHVGMSLPRMATHLTALRRRFGVTTTAQAAREARRAGLL